VLHAAPELGVITHGEVMEFYFYPSDENTFKNEAVGNLVRTVVFETSSGEVVLNYIRQVKKHWEQTCKNNIETDHRIKELAGDNYQVYSWVTIRKYDFGLPCFILHG